MSSYHIDIHADDYALSPSSDLDIITLCKAGKLDSISVMPNMAICDTACKLFLNEKSNFPKKIKISIHLNFVEGKCCAPYEKVSHLIDENGLFTVSWGKLLLWSYSPFVRKKIRAELSAEIIAQTEKMIHYGILDSSALRFDSHQHPHMIPIVFDALVDAISEMQKKNYKVEYIRCATDPILPYLKKIELYKTFSPINIIKCIILNVLSHKAKHELKKMNMPVSYLCGVFFSDNMDSYRVKKMIPALAEKAEKENRPLEILFHPGLMLESELSDEINFVEAHTSKNRHVEFDAVMNI